MYKRLLPCAALMLLISGCGSAPSKTASPEAPPLYTVDLKQIEFAKDALGADWARFVDDSWKPSAEKRNPEKPESLPTQIKDVTFFNRTNKTVGFVRVLILKTESHTDAEHYLDYLRKAFPGAAINGTQFSGIPFAEFSLDNKRVAFVKVGNLVFFATTTDERSRKALDQLMPLVLVKTGVVTEKSARK